MDKVLVTGMSGLIGSAVLHRLQGSYQLSALNRRDVPGVPTLQADVGNLAAIRPAFEGIHTVVHLASAFQDDGWEAMFSTNITGAYNIFEASREAGVKRVIFGSSSSVTAHHEGDEPHKAIIEGRYDDVPPNRERITHTSPLRPNSIYGCSKIWGEALGRYYSETYGISVIILRFSFVTKDDRPDTPRRFANWCSQRDAGQMVARCIQAPPDLAFDIFYATSNNRWGYRDISHAREVLGYDPQDSAENFQQPPG